MDNANPAMELKELISVYDWLLLNGIMVQEDYSKQVDYILSNNRLPDAGPGITFSGEAPFTILHMRADGPAKEAQKQGLIRVNDVLEQVNNVSVAPLSSNYVRVLLLGPPGTKIILQCRENPPRTALGRYRIALRRKLVTQGGDTVLAKPHPALPGLGRAAAPAADLNRRFDCAERAIKATYDPTQDSWEHTLINVVLQAPFAEGSMRTAHYMIDLTEPEPKGKFVLKMSRDADGAGQVRWARPSPTRACRRFLICDLSSVGGNSVRSTVGGQSVRFEWIFSKTLSIPTARPTLSANSDQPSPAPPSLPGHWLAEP